MKKKDDHEEHEHGGDCGGCGEDCSCGMTAEQRAIANQLQKEVAQAINRAISKTGKADVSVFAVPLAINLAHMFLQCEETGGEKVSDLSKATELTVRIVADSLRGTYKEKEDEQD